MIITELLENLKSNGRDNIKNNGCDIELAGYHDWLYDRLYYSEKYEFNFTTDSKGSMGVVGYGFVNIPYDECYYEFPGCACLALRVSEMEYLAHWFHIDSTVRHPLYAFTATVHEPENKAINVYSYTALEESISPITDKQADEIGTQIGGNPLLANQRMQEHNMVATTRKPSPKLNERRVNINRTPIFEYTEYSHNQRRGTR